MTNFAKVIGGKVEQVIVASQATIDSGIFGSINQWIETTNASKGYYYDALKNVFYPPPPYPSWTLDNTNKWTPPVALPTDGKYYKWNEATTNWVEVN
jgi:hypothetical protein